MALFYSSGFSKRDSGKFRSTPRHGLQTEERQGCGDYQFELLSVQSTGGAVERKRYHVRVSNAKQIRVAYLRDFLSPSQAFDAARQWVEEREKSNHRGW